MSIGHLRMCANHETSPLDGVQQASFDKAYAELNRDIAERIETSLQSAMPKMEFAWPTAGLDLSALIPKIDLAFTTSSAYDRLSESTRASFERIQRNLTAHLEAAHSISVPAVGSSETSENADSLETLKVAATSVLHVTPDELLDDVDADLDQFGLLGSAVELLEEQSVLMRQQSEVVQSQRDSAARGVVFYVVVGLGSALSGIATVVGLDERSDRVWSLALLAIVAVVACLAYFMVRWWQGRGDNSASS